MHGMVPCWRHVPVLRSLMRTYVGVHQSEASPRFLPIPPLPQSLSPSDVPPEVRPKRAKVRRCLCNLRLAYTTRRSLGDTAVLVLKLPFFEGVALSLSS
jgi:hypothetical protein